MNKYKAKYTKKAFAAIFDNIKDDPDFLRAFDKIYAAKNPGYDPKSESQRAEKRAAYLDKLGKDITFYLYDFDYLEKPYLDISHMVIRQCGRDCLVDLDTIYDIFAND